MSQENVEVRSEAVRRWFWAFENDTDIFRSSLHPEIEWFPIEEDHTPTYGVEGAMRLRNEWLDTWDEHRVDLEDVIEEGESVVVLATVTARGKASGVEVNLRVHYQFKVRDDKVVYLYEHEDRQEALEAAGLSE
jgi:ketosteroid isomerase-like protein